MCWMGHTQAPQTSAGPLQDTHVIVARHDAGSDPASSGLSKVRLRWCWFELEAAVATLSEGGSPWSVLLSSLPMLVWKTVPAQVGSFGISWLLSMLLPDPNLQCASCVPIARSPHSHSSN